MFCDMVADSSNSVADNYFLGVWSGGANLASQALVNLPGRDITFYFQGIIGGLPAGNTTFDIMLGSGGNTGAVYQFSSAMNYLIYEVFLPTSDGGYSPAPFATSGTLGANSSSASYRRDGRLVFVEIDISITASGGSGSLYAHLPVNAASKVFCLSAFDRNAGTPLVAFISPDSGVGVVHIANSDGSYPGIAGKRLIVSGTYEAA